MLPLQGAGVQLLVEELRSHMLCGVVKKKRKKNVAKDGLLGMRWEGGFRDCHLISKLSDSSVGVCDVMCKAFQEHGQCLQTLPDFSQLWAETVKLSSVAQQCELNDWVEKRKELCVYGGVCVCVYVYVCVRLSGDLPHMGRREESQGKTMGGRSHKFPYMMVYSIIWEPAASQMMGSDGPRCPPWKVLMKCKPHPCQQLSIMEANPTEVRGHPCPLSPTCI